MTRIPFFRHKHVPKIIGFVCVHSIFALLSASIAFAQCQIVWTDEANNQVRRLGLRETIPTVLIDNIDSPSFLALDPRAAGSLFISSSENGTILKSKLDGTDLTTLMSGLVSPRGIAVDAVNDKLYWTETRITEPGPEIVAEGEIKRSDLDGTNVETLVTALSLVGDIAVSPESSQLFWTESLGFDAALQSSSLVGSNIQTISLVEGGPGTPPGRVYLGLGLAIEYGEDSSLPIAVVWGVTRREQGSVSFIDGGGRFDRVILADSSTSTLFNTPGLLFSSNSFGISRPTSAAISDSGNIFWTANTVFKNIRRWEASSGTQNSVTQPEVSAVAAPLDIELISADNSALCSLFPAAQPSQNSTVWRQSSGTWFLRIPIEQFERITDVLMQQWGLPGDVPLFTAPNGANIGVWRPSSGNWYRCISTLVASRGMFNCSSSSSLSPVQFGIFGDYPISGDFDGDEVFDLAVWRPTSGNWFILRSSDNVSQQRQWGLPGDIPVSADFDGDDILDLTVWRPSTGTWYTRLSSTDFSNAPGVAPVQQWGLPEDHPMPGDYDGDDKADYAVWRPSNGTWYVCSSTTNYDCAQGVAVQFGLPGDIPVSLDFDRDGRLDYVVWRPASGTWFYLSSSTGAYALQQWGLPDDIPLPGSMRTLIERLLKP